MRKQFDRKFEDLICVENLLEAWRVFLVGKRSKIDVQDFSLRLMDNILSLHNDLKTLTYKHGEYKAFNISDPKPRNIHKASVRDRLLHHAIHRQLYPFFDKIFISDSYSCRINKGVHKAIGRFESFSKKVSKNNTKSCYVLKCDIKKFFASVDHVALEKILKSYVPDYGILKLLSEVITSFHTTSSGVGVPLGNLTSQLFVNIYMNEFDQFVKHKLKAKYYIRYADDFVFLSQNKRWLENLIPEIQEFLSEELRLEMHPNKVFIKTVASGLDFLGWVHFPDHKVLRTTTKRRGLRRIAEKPTPETLSSYLGLISHGNAEKIHAEFFKTYILSLSPDQSHHTFHPPYS